jgi:hypothetical protein
VQFPCPTCSATLSLPDDSAGRRAQCPSCQATFRVPDIAPAPFQSDSTDAVIRSERKDAVGCPGCDRLLAFDVTSAGQIVICPSCQRRIKMPTAVEMQGIATPRPTLEARPSSTFDTPRDAPRPLIQRDDPYASPPLTSGGPYERSETNYAPPGWSLFGISVINLGYDFIWIGIIALGMLSDNAQADPDAAVGFAVFILWAVVAFIMHSIMLIAGLRMTQKRSLGLVRAGSIMGILPCGVCAIVQIPIGIWAVTVAYGSNATRDFSE